MNMKSEYNFVLHCPRARKQGLNIVSIHKSGKVAINEDTVDLYKKVDRPEFVQIYVDRVNKVIALKFYEKKDIFGMPNLLKLHKNKRSYYVYSGNLLENLGVKPETSQQIKSTRSKEDLMVIDLRVIKRKVQS